MSPYGAATAAIWPGAFPEIEEAVRRLPDDTAADCELIVREAARLAFERLQQRMHRRGAAAARAAAEFPAHLVASDLLRVHVPSLGACDVAESRSQATVLRDEIEPGSEAQIDYGFLGW
ncbi:hypothetical protein [Streptomyces sp. NPDC051001]|uniref:hypothetical protein n=1 Tax=Streptomyces sp. NPDC051001 TaxID=3155795 RepID=UPI00343DE0BF